MHPETVIIGGGFAGLQACRALARDSIGVLLIDPRPGPVMLPALPDVAGGWVPERITHRPFNEILPTNVVHLPWSVSAIDLDAGTVVADGETIAYRQLLIAAGSVPNFYDSPFPRDRLIDLGDLPGAVGKQKDAVARRVRLRGERHGLLIDQSGNRQNGEPPRAMATDIFTLLLVF